VATYENPLAQSEGIELVFVNGELGLEAGTATERHAGRLLRLPKRQAA
jgi:hypothetical protein